jgi:quercetin dioxygenase-like cupin family protein
MPMSARFLAIALFVGGVAGCGDTPGPSAPATEHTMSASSHVGLQSMDPFTMRAPLEPFRILETPDLMIHSRADTDLVIQRLNFAPGAGGWHTHPGPSFIVVAAGQIKLERYSPKSGCTETQVFEAGDAYFEVANEVHRAVVLSSEDAVLHVARIIPAGAALSTQMPAPPC